MKAKLIKEYEDILNELEQIKQDKEWHAEGNVKIHTLMVLEALFSDNEFNNLPEEEKELLAIATIFHDLGKIYTTKEENGRIISPNHSKVGANEFRKRYFDSFEFEKREAIANLIRNHGYPIHYYKKEEHDIVRLAEVLNTKYLYLLAKADVNGRISEGKEEYLLNIEYFKEQAEKFVCYGTKKEFSSTLEREFFFKKGYIYKPFEKLVSHVILLSGLPGVGKDHYIKEIDLPVISLDQIRKEMKVKHGDKKGTGHVLQKAKEEIKKLLAKKEDFVFNATNLNKNNREKWISLFKEYEAIVTIVYIEKPLKTILKQNKEREDSIPEGNILKYLKNLEVPTPDEANFIKYEISK